ncbi:MAG: hypothetical protein HY996_05710 [Micrococcales bacterium]|nr:hypothetical protein [Micrococcales bacterium]
MPPTPALTHAATVGYLASIALGTAVQARVLDTRGYRWLHHVLYTGTAILTLAALAAGLVRRAPETALLAPAMVPLAALPHAGRRMHARVALAAAPWFAAAALSASTRSGRRR